jgi:hypothetical protein
MRTVVWYRANDLRISDHAPVQDASKGGEVIPLFVLDPDEYAFDRAGASRAQTEFLLGRRSVTSRRALPNGARGSLSSWARASMSFRAW